MAVKNKGLKDFEELLNKLVTEVPKRVGKEYEKKYYDFLELAIDTFYNSYSPKFYDRTYNFARIGSGAGSSVTVNNTTLHVEIGFNYMDNYVRGGKENFYYIDAEYAGTNAFKEALHGPEFLDIKTTPTPIDIFVEKSQDFIRETVEKEVIKLLKGVK